MNLQGYSEEQVAELKHRMEDPVWFAENILGVETWKGEADFMRAVAKYSKVTHKSGHKTGKSFSLACLALWWAFTKEDARVPITSASFGQVKKILWREIRKRYYASLIPLGGECYRDPASGIIFPNGNEIFGFSTAEPENAAGISAANILYEIDEGSGVDELVYEAMEGNMAAGAKMVICSNPTKTVGMFFDTFHTKAEFWHQVTTSSEQSPNITGEKEIPGLATEQWIREKELEWGRNSPQFAVRVLGRFPTQASNAVIGLSSVEEAQQRYNKAPTQGVLRIGVDPARFGDDETVIQPVRGVKALESTVMMNAKGQDIAGKVIEIIKKLKRPTDESIRVTVDTIGLGASPTDFLDVFNKYQDVNLDVRAVNVSKNSDKPDKYHDLRTQLCFELRDWLEMGGCIPPEDKLLAQECTAPTYQFDVQGRSWLDSKKVEKKNIGRSPDRRNALELAIYTPRNRNTIGGGMMPM